MDSGGEAESGRKFEWNSNMEQEVRNYFYRVAGRYQCMSARELNFAKLKARNAAAKWIEKDNGNR